MYNGKQNNKDKDKKVNTRGFQFNNKNGIDPSTLIVGYWGDTVTLRIHPALPQEKQTTESVYDYEHSLNIVLSIERVEALNQKIKEMLLAIDQNKPYRSGIAVGETSAVVISNGLKETDSIRPFIGIYRDLDNSKQAGQGIRFEFASTKTYNNYDPETGEIESEEQTMGQFDAFVKAMKFATEALSNASVHAMRNVENFYKSKLLDTVESIATKNGISVGRNRNNTNGAMFNINNSNEPDLPNAEVEESDDLPF